MFSVVILTKDEEGNLPACLASVAWCDDVVVLDSGSVDRTVEIARAAGVRVFSRVFDDFASQRNYANRELPWRHDWVFHLDADERFTPELRVECEAAIARDECSAYMVPAKMMLWGRWLRHAAAYPVYQMRFLKRGEANFRQVGHGQRECAVKRGMGRFRRAYEHHSFGKGLEEWVARHNRYSSEEAAETVRHLAAGERFDWGGVFGVDRVRRRRALKSLSFRLPGRAGIKFVYLYILRGGFLDGRPGLAYCLMQATYEQLISLKVCEHRARARASQRGPHPGNA